MRSRLIAGLKRYFHAKRLEGLLSSQVGLGLGFERVIGAAQGPWMHQLSTAFGAAGHVLVAPAAVPARWCQRVRS